MSEKTKNVTLVLEGLPPVTKEEIGSAIDELANLVKNFCGGAIQQHILNSDNKEISI